ncbi:viral A-type inclusion protein [Reticulomyxa filosa]|uniref:Viral A-type inclusion protein n=1 Tax=Reticulomyxa filosa TaxID=46433 RepID=X6P7D7_RETFI|nr:viral A-type inclusion protein [Reticulomyxa filosa]|eukprot:ETO33552.1 viral A-type inclusion protein [Reticulomyxa filosa]
MFVLFLVPRWTVSFGSVMYFEECLKKKKVRKKGLDTIRIVETEKVFDELIHQLANDMNVRADLLRKIKEELFNNQIQGWKTLVNTAQAKKDLDVLNDKTAFIKARKQQLINTKQQLLKEMSAKNLPLQEVRNEWNKEITEKENTLKDQINYNSEVINEFKSNLSFQGPSKLSDSDDTGEKNFSQIDTKNSLLLK